MSTTVDNLIRLAQAKGLIVTEQTKFTKVSNPSGTKALYIGRAKRVVTRIDLAGFDTSGLDGVRVLTKDDAKRLRLGQVRGQILPPKDNLDPSTTEQVFDSALDRLLDSSEGTKFVPSKKEKSEPKSE